MFRRNAWKVVLLGIIVFAAFLRLWQLDKVPTGISDDEVKFFINAKAVFYTGYDLKGDWSPFSFVPQNGTTGKLAQAELPPLIMAPFVGPFAFSLFTSKLPYVFISVAQIVLLFLIVNRLVGRNEAIVVALVAAINPWSIFFGRTAYEAPLAIFFYLLSWYLLLIVKKWKILLVVIPLFLGFYILYGNKTYFHSICCDH